jgi:hypothetical protein
MNQEFSLPPPFAVAVLNGIGPVLGTHQRPINLIKMPKIVEEIRQGHDAMPVGEYKPDEGVSNGLTGGGQVNDLVLGLGV